MGGQVILVVEDEVLIRMVIADVLREEGYEVIEAATGEEAMTILLSARHLDLMITDVKMPGRVDGIDLAASFKRLRLNRPVVMASGHLSPTASYPADVFLPKPYTNKMVVDAVESLIGPACHNKAQDRDVS